MSDLVGRVLGVLFMALLGLASLMYIKSLRAELETAQEAAQTAQQGNTDRDATIKQLQDIEKAKDIARAKLEGERTAIRSILSDRETLIGKLTHENAELRAWSLTPLPGDVSRLRNHPAYTGAASYRDGLRSRQPLPAAGSDSPH